MAAWASPGCLWQQWQMAEWQQVQRGGVEVFSLLKKEELWGNLSTAAKSLLLYLGVRFRNRIWVINTGFMLAIKANTE